MPPLHSNPLTRTTPLQLLISLSKSALALISLPKKVTNFLHRRRNPTTSNKRDEENLCGADGYNEDGDEEEESFFNEKKSAFLVDVREVDSDSNSNSNSDDGESQGQGGDVNVGMRGGFLSSTPSNCDFCYLEMEGTFSRVCDGCLYSWGQWLEEDELDEDIEDTIYGNEDTDGEVVVKKCDFCDGEIKLYKGGVEKGNRKEGFRKVCGECLEEVEYCLEGSESESEFTEEEELVEEQSTEEILTKEFAEILGVSKNKGVSMEVADESKCEEQKQQYVLMDEHDTELPDDFARARRKQAWRDRRRQC